MAELISKYENGNYTVELYSDGTKIRTTTADTFIPKFAESIDMTVSHKCSHNCKYCYLGCNENGCTVDFKKYPWILNSIRPGTEVAINGNDVTDKNLEYFFNLMKERGVIVNITVNQIEFMEHYDKIKELVENKYVYGVGVSYTHKEDGFIERLKEFDNAVVHLVVGIVGLDDLDYLKDNDLKILFLGYKKIGRGSDYFSQFKNEVKENIAILAGHLEMYYNHFKIISFDNLAIEQLGIEVTPDTETYMGDDGQFTFYIDLVSETFARSSILPKKFQHKIKYGRPVDNMFKIVRRDNAGKKIPIKQW